MTREIKFRAWDIENKCFVKPTRQQGGFEDTVYIEIETGKVLQYDGHCDCGGVSLAPKDFELMQYTGLKDKNGKEIYEGDFVNIGEEQLGRFVWENYGFTLEIWVDKDEWDNGKWYDYDLEDMKSEDFEIIGNIYENSELIK